MKHPTMASIPVEELEKTQREIKALRRLTVLAGPIIINYAQANPKHIYDGREQDPMGAHRWLQVYDEAVKELRP